MRVLRADAGMNSQQIILGWPPSVNTYWRSVRGRVLISAKGRAYREESLWMAKAARLEPFGEGKIDVAIAAYLPDARRRDADNLFKAPLDALAHAGVYADDSQIRKLSIELCGIDRENPRLEITLKAIGATNESA
jgi:crossover junction endodeoxyribonuclease RusA